MKKQKPVIAVDLGRVSSTFDKKKKSLLSAGTWVHTTLKKITEVLALN